jgi:hypothetical protein
MASQTFDEAMKNQQEMEVTAPDGRTFTGNFCDPKLDRSTLPAGWYAYDIRHDDDGCGIFCTMEHDPVMVNNAGTFFLQTEIPELSAAGSSINFAIDEEEWKMDHKSDEPCPPSSPTDWDYSFM